MGAKGRKSCTYTDHLGLTLERLARPGLLLAAKGPAGKQDNAMTIGWATFGIVWGLPMCVVLVRPSRYTYGLIEAAQDFTVNVPAEGMAEAVAFLGTASGRDRDKLAAVGLAPTPSGMVSAPTLAECQVTHECRVVHQRRHPGAPGAAGRPGVVPAGRLPPALLRSDTGGHDDAVEGSSRRARVGPARLRALRSAPRHRGTD